VKYSMSTKPADAEHHSEGILWQSNSSAWPDVWQDWVAKSAGING
jgi:hypothetical protein